MIPSRRILLEAQEQNQKLGHENRGFLSESHGFMPTQQPSLKLSDSHRIWDEMAANLPEMFRTLTLRLELDRMPVLSAQAGALPDADLLRASAIFGIFAHAYHYVQPTPYEGIPDSILQPWLQISQRLEQPAPHLSFTDLNVYNWRYIDPNDPNPMRMENLALLIPILGNEDERRFQMTPTEMMGRFAPVMLAVIRAQEAVAAEDVNALQDELRFITSALNALTYETFMKVNPNSYHPLYVNPVVWGKTVAPLATPFQTEGGIPGPSGTAIPAFQLLDIFFGRSAYASSIGRETNHARSWFPPNWRAFLDAAEEISIVDFVKQVSNKQLTGIFQTAMNSYAGETGLLGRHRLKTYGFLDLSFKAGRSKTLGGFAGAFDDRMWDKMDGELERARLERYTRYPQASHYVTIKNVLDVRREGDQWVKQISFDLRGTGLSCQPGDRCAVLPENDPDLVQKTLAALRAHGDEPIQLNLLWREAVKLRDGYEDAKVLSLRTLLTFGCLRPISRAAAKTLYGITHNETLWQILEARAEDQWELWDLLNLLAKGGFDTRRLWKAEPGEVERICRIVPPENFRIYSITSIENDPQTDEVSAIHLMVGQLAYETPETEITNAATRKGTGSGYLSRLSASNMTENRRVSIRLLHPPRFSLPQDLACPIVMFAGGTGLAPFRSLIQERVREQSGENWLFFGTRTRDDLYYASELESHVAKGKLNLRVAFSREDASLEIKLKDGYFAFAKGMRSYIDAEMLIEENASQLYQLLLRREEGGLGAVFYVCGHADFAMTVFNAIKSILRRKGHSEEKVEQMVYHLVGENRYLQEVFTTYAGAHFSQDNVIPASEVVSRNNDEDGYWMIIDGRVYDVSEFVHLHPGGLKIMRSYSGMDATNSYRMVLHQANPEVDALLAMYEIGAVRRLDLSQGWGIALSDDGLQFASLQDLYRMWARLLYQVVEMENALANDFSIRNEPVTYDEKTTGVAPSTYRWQQYLQSHARFRHDYQSKIMDEPLHALWLMTGSLCSETVEAGWMKKMIASIQSSSQANKTKDLDAKLLKELQESSSKIDFESVCALLERVDKRFLKDVKLTLRAGIMVFEQYESKTLTHGQNALLTVIQSLPRCLTDYYDTLDGVLV